MSASAKAASGVFSQRMVERRDRADHALQRFAQRIDLARLAVVRQVAGEHLAIVDQRLVGGKEQHVRGTAHLVHRVLQAQPRFERDQPRQRLLARSDDRAGTHQDRVALVARQRRLVQPCNRQRAAHVFERGLRHRGDDVAGPRIAHVDRAVAVHLLAADAQGLAQREVYDGGGLHEASLVPFKA